MDTSCHRPSFSSHRSWQNSTGGAQRGRLGVGVGGMRIGGQTTTHSKPVSGLLTLTDILGASCCRRAPQMWSWESALQPFHDPVCITASLRSPRRSRRKTGGAFPSVKGELEGLFPVSFPPEVGGEAVFQPELVVSRSI